MVNKKKGYAFERTSANIRSSYLEQIRLLDVSITDFLDEAIGKHLDVLDKTDEWIYQQMNTRQKEIDGLKTLLTQRAKEKQELQLMDQELQYKYEDFCAYLCNQEERYNTERVNKKYGIHLKSFSHFKELQEQNNNGGFNLEAFKKLGVKP